VRQIGTQTGLTERRWPDDGSVRATRRHARRSITTTTGILLFSRSLTPITATHHKHLGKILVLNRH